MVVQSEPLPGALPALSLGHGAPPLLEDPTWTRELADWADRLPRPKGIVILSAHWESAPLAISATGAKTPLVYDFSGFWVPLKVMYPLADVPVLQLSLPTHDPGHLYRLGDRLRPLREQGVLIIGSGFMTHGLPFLTGEMMHGGAVPGWSADFDAWATEAANRGDLDTLADYRRAPGMPYAHPTPEHFSPLFLAFGAAGPQAAIRTSIDGYMWGLSKRSLQWDIPSAA